MTDITPIHFEAKINQNVSDTSSKESLENAQSIFGKIDKDNNGKISAEEAKEYGFNLFEIKEDIDKKDFQTKIFKTHYDNNASKGIIYDVSKDLTEIEKNELLDRIKSFEEYKNTLDKSELDELEKNKSENLDFALKNVPDGEKNYKEFLAKYERFKNGDFSKITNEDLFQLLNYTDTTDTKIDGVIGSFTQGRNGDCWFLSMLNNYASTKEGAENIKNRIRQENGKYYVKFNLPDNPTQTKEYEVSEEDMQNYGISASGVFFSSGDKDVRLLEIATAKMLRDYMDTEKPDEYYSAEIKKEAKKENWDEEKTNKYIEYCKLASVLGGGSAVKRALVQKALGYTGNILMYNHGMELAENFLNGISEENFESIEAAKEARKKLVRASINQPIYETELKLKFSADKKGKKIASIDTNPENIKNTGAMQLADIIKDYNCSDLTCGSDVSEYSDNPKEQRYISGGHVFNVEKTENGEITINDPYNSGFAHTISTKDFERHMTGLSFIPKSKHQ